jgi:Na+-transporting methylmalonyl-CoA/oxaloacetate decarboxylase beta subunit
VQPVTIKNNQYFNTLWITQVLLAVLASMLVWIAVASNLWLLMLLPITCLLMWVNHRSIKHQSKYQYSMRSNGQLIISEQSPALNNSILPNEDDMVVEIKAFWQLPHLLFLQLTTKLSSQPIYICLFRPVVGATNFSQILVGITQINPKLKSQL